VECCDEQDCSYVPVIVIESEVIKSENHAVTDRQILVLAVVLPLVSATIGVTLAIVSKTVMNCESEVRSK